MIYKNNTTPPLVLTESDADAFLESVGVKLYDDEISIDGTLYEGSYGESILEANGIYLYEDGIVLEGKQVNDHLERLAADKERMSKSTKDYNRNRSISGKDNSMDLHGRGHSKLSYNARNLAFRMYDTERDNRESKLDGAKHVANIMAKKELNKTDFSNLRKLEKSRKEREVHKTTHDKYTKDARDSLKRLEDQEVAALEGLERNIRRHPKRYGLSKSGIKESSIFSDIDII